MNSHRARIIKWTVGLMLGLPALYLLALGPRDSDDAPAGFVVVDYWEKWGGGEGAAMQQIVDSFNATVGREKRIYVRYLSITDISRKMLVSTAAGVPPDIAGVWDGQIVQYAARDALEPLDALAAEAGITAEQYKRVYWDICSWRGNLWALPSTPAATALHYNRRIFRQERDALLAAGLDPDRAPATIAELDAYAAALDRRDPRNARRILRAGFLPLHPDWFLNYYVYWFGGDLFDAARDRFTFTSPEVIRTYHWMRGYSQKLGVESATEFSSGFATFNSSQNPFLIDQVVMLLQGPWMANYIEMLAPRMNRALVPQVIEPFLPRVLRTANYDWAVAPFPSAVPGVDDVTYCGLDVLTIPKGARHKREAFEFLKYVNRPEVMERLCSLHCKHSPLSSVSDRFIRDHPNPYIDVFERLSSGPNAKGPQQVPILTEVTDEVNYLTQRVYAHAATPEDALRHAQSRLEAKYAQYKEIHEPPGR